MRRTILVLVAGAAAASVIPFALALGRTPFPERYSLVAVDRHGELLGARAASDGQWRFPPGDSVPERFALCLIRSEDKRFYRHPGLDPIALGRAAVKNLRARKIVEGGSTLSQQLARLARRDRLGPRPRTLFEKIPEALEAMAFEVRWTKRELLAQYAAHAPFGANVVGLEAAAWRWYGKEPDRLSWAEAALLASLPNRPARLHPSGDRPALKFRRDRLLRRLHAEGFLGEENLSLALGEPLPQSPRALPDLAPHLVEWLARGYPAGGRFRLTLDAAWQREALAAAIGHRRELAGLDVRGLAVMAAQPGPDGRPEVRVYIGHPEPEDPEAGRVDGAAAPRSPGSALKPFLYGLALDQGLLLPRQWILDIPTRFGDFVPENSLRNYRGAVAADEALCLSLNVPFVRLLRETGADAFLDHLHRLGFSKLNRPASHYGLSLILGGGETTLIELSAAYASLWDGATGGGLRIGYGPGLGDSTRVELVLPGGPAQPEVLSVAARQSVLNALSRPGRVEEESWRTRLGPTRPLAWKTGTSFGQRDAWALGLTPRFYVGVWAGNPSGEGRAGLWGARSASPLMFRILDLLESRRRDGPVSEFAEEPTGWPVPACALTGYRAGADCPRLDTVFVPEAGKMAAACTWHRRIQVRKGDGLRASPDCARGELRDSVVFDPPGAVAAYLRGSDGGLRTLPPWAPGCGNREGDQALEILQPEIDARLTPGLGFGGQRQRLVFEAGHRDPGATLHWFLDGEYLGETVRFHRMGALPPKGRHALVVSDEEGRTAGVWFQVLR